ncbi:bifunctional phosphopantothenoylcysteine decarboxylase/phosphopantothenate synthase [Rhodospirillum rubrum F11]|uniref:Coenzyme A biosynthesis bifunctional protein CoaBC n=2 Tax=Rhodospirillum rubrum TaxID=1085 RepID=Q2RMQ5_RHORT|nr:bifunctional phosphopantothenoylcysteine decarboxylase/phosphopantothenate--cysteine ligase CoaBC [Rhodospirillum rubrum]ABC24590.1 Phosphopantothenate-cysteine ligase / Phosphopantothenoylcysteine decarboxylase [Rhodospirillum rubrum ATCC 11170]AEO50343.1 bifunctional phosphopantothenoylcysteine decarboxylase/phosphopantothenate synthase [Rhodospirillum rubrum F11]MBK5956322.1 bifunctional phosphopantothenoylcysteine decarboxylase/phosphopantothenate synthase [Rhodospirillum rubrum]QXG80504
MNDKRILLIVAGGIAAYKSLDLIRRLRDQGARVRCVLTRGGSQFVTQLSLAALSGEPVYQDLFSLTDETEMGHIRLSREADIVVVAPATADLLAKMAGGHADDLASTTLLATDKPVLVAPTMNLFMWAHPATRANMALLESRGIHRVGPGSGDMACGEQGEGRMAEVPEILAAIKRVLGLSPAAPGPLSGRHALVTSGPTHEPIDPVRYIANRSSGHQGHAIAGALARLGARVTLVSGPTALADPPGTTVVRVTTAREMLAACQQALPADIAVCAAAVADWTVTHPATHKTKKAAGAPPPVLALSPNPDILANLAAAGPQRPALVVGFAAETEEVVAQASAKRLRKGCDWIIANDVSEAGNGGRGTVFASPDNTVHVITAEGVEDWPTLSKDVVAHRLAGRIAATLTDRAAAPCPSPAQKGSLA